MINVIRKPRKCPFCRSQVVEIIYGEPTKEDIIAAEKDELRLGGCSMEPNAPDWQCIKCNAQFRKVQRIVLQ